MHFARLLPFLALTGYAANARSLTRRGGKLISSAHDILLLSKSLTVEPDELSEPDADAAYGLYAEGHEKRTDESSKPDADAAYGLYTDGNEKRGEEGSKPGADAAYGLYASGNKDRGEEHNDPDADAAYGLYAEGSE